MEINTGTYVHMSPLLPLLVSYVYKNTNITTVYLLCISYNALCILYYSTMVAAKRILVKLAKVCVNSTDLFYWSIKLCLITLSGYISKTDSLGENVSSAITDIQKSFMAWFPSTGFGDYFGGKNGKMIKNEIKVYNTYIHTKLYMFSCIPTYIYMCIY